MSKQSHDEISAKGRKPNYDKEYFHLALDYAKGEILDIGAGNGEFAELVKWGPTTRQVICIDYADPHLKRLHELGCFAIKLDFDNPEALKEKAEELKGRFDAVTCFEFIEHIFSVDDLFTFCHKVLKPGGRLIISTPNMAYPLHHIFSWINGYPLGEGHHVRFWCRRRLEQALVLDGFEVVKDLSHGRGIDYRKMPLLLRPLLKALSYIGNRKLMLVAEKQDVEPIGFERTWREGDERLHSMKNWLRVQKHVKAGLFADHTDLITYLDNVEKEMKEIDEHDQYGNPGPDYFKGPSYIEFFYEIPFTLFAMAAWMFFEVKSKLFKK